MLKILDALGIAYIVGWVGLRWMRAKSQSPITSGPPMPSQEVETLLPLKLNRDELLWMLEMCGE